MLRERFKTNKQQAHPVASLFIDILLLSQTKGRNVCFPAELESVANIIMY